MHGDINVDAQFLISAGVHEQLIVSLCRHVQVELAQKQNEHQQAAQHRDCVRAIICRSTKHSDIFKRSDTVHGRQFAFQKARCPVGNRAPCNACYRDEWSKVLDLSIAETSRCLATDRYIIYQGAASILSRAKPRCPWERPCESRVDGPYILAAPV